MSNEKSEIEALVLQNLDLPKRIVETRIKKLTLPNDYWEELHGAANLVLVEAARSFDATRGKPFREYASFRISHGVIDYVRKLAPVSSYAYRKLKGQTLCTWTSLSDQLRQKVVDAAEELSQRSDTPEASYRRKERNSYVAEAIEKLPELYRRTVIQRFYEDKEPNEIVADEGVEVRALVMRRNRAVKMLRSELEGDKYWLDDCAA